MAPHLSRVPDEHRKRRRPAGDRPGQWRTFLAIPLPADVTRALGALQGARAPRERDAVRWVDPEGIHLTVRFLGGIDPERVPAIEGALRDAARQTGRFQLRLGDCGAFPSLRRPRVLWVGLAGELDRLRQLHARLEGALSRVGFEPDPRAFTPHLTVGRVRNGLDRWSERRVGEEFGARCGGPDAPPFTAASITLFRSHLTGTGASYEALCDAAFD